jgi:hypothetical protein
MLVFMPFFGYSMTTHKLGMLLFLLLCICIHQRLQERV